MGARLVTARYIVGNTLDVLRDMPAGSVDLVLSSPPFLALRSYLPADHPDKAKEIGSEPTPGAFIDTLLDVVEECRRVLAPHGSLCFELGDTYAGSGGAGGDYNANGLREGQAKFRQTRPNEAWRLNDDGTVKTRLEAKNGTHTVPLNAGPGWPLDKSLCLIPELLRVALVYGFNPLTGRTTPLWRARNVVRWCRPNPPVGALGDKVRPATSDIIVACVSGKRYFDLDAVRGPGSTNTHARTARGVESRPSSGKSADDENRGGNWSTLATIHDTNGAPPLDHWWHPDKDEFFSADTFDQDAWHIPTHGYPGSHYATWPPALLKTPILSMCPQRVCTTCGRPSERIAHTTNAVGLGTIRSRQPGHERALLSTHVPDCSERVTAGWTDCGHGGTWRQGVVLDPFAGSGTTMLVAHGHARSSIGIDLDARNADLARERVGMWLDVEHHVAAPVEVA